jgi:hypothetical protein
MNWDHKCKICKKRQGQHKAKTLNCPTGTKTRVGYITWHNENVFVPVKSRKKKEEFTL